MRLVSLRLFIFPFPQRCRILFVNRSRGIPVFDTQKKERMLMSQLTERRLLSLFIKSFKCPVLELTFTEWQSNERDEKKINNDRLNLELSETWEKLESNTETKHLILTAKAY